MDEPTVEVKDWPDMLKASKDAEKAFRGLLTDD